MRCPNCGRVIRKEQGVCPHCHWKKTAGKRRRRWERASVPGFFKLVLVIAAVLLFAVSLLGAREFLSLISGREDPRPAATLPPLVTEEPVILPRLTPEPTQEAGPPVIRTPEQLIRAVRNMQEQGVSRLVCRRIELSNAQIADAFLYISCVRRYRCEFGPDQDVLIVTWYPGMKIWHAVLNGQVSALSAEEQQILHRAQAVVGEVTNPSMTDLEKEIALHDYIILNCDFLEDPENYDTHTVAGFFNHGKAQCAGYVDTFFLLGRLAGLDVVCVSGNILRDGRYHTWNLVRLDGLWYAVDLTWNDPPGGNSEQHTYLNIPHDSFEGLRSWNPASMPDGPYARSRDGG